MEQTDRALAKAVGVTGEEELPYLAWPGGYPLFYLDKDNEVYCPACANHERPFMRWYGVNWEDTALYCDVCGKQITSAYGDDGEGG